MRDKMLLVADRVDELVRHAQPQHPPGCRFRQRLGHRAAEATAAPVLFQRHHKRGRPCRVDQCFRVERPQGVQVQHGALDAVSGEGIRCVEAGEHRIRPTAREHHVAAVPQCLRLPDDRWHGPNGMDVFLLVCAEAGQIPPLDTFTVTTPSGGTHLYFTAPDGVELRNTQGERGNGLGWGIDIRANGGYVVAPARSGGAAATPRAPAVLPAWLAERLRPAALPPQQPTTIATGHGRRARYLDTAIQAEVARVRTAVGGERNFTLYCAATALGQLVAGGELDDQEVTATLLDAARDHVAADAYGWNQAHKTIASGLRAGAARPRKVAA